CETSTRRYCVFSGGLWRVYLEPAAPSIHPTIRFDFDAQGNRINFRPITTNANLAIDSDRKAPFTHHFTLSSEQQRRSDVAIQVNGIVTRGNQAGGWEDIGGTWAP